MAKHNTTSFLRLRPIVTVFAALFGTSALAALPSAPTAVSPGRTHPDRTNGTNIVVANCGDRGPGSLRAAILSAKSGDTIDLTQLTCSRISLTTGALTVPQPDLFLAGPGRHKLVVDAGNSSVVLVHTSVGSGTLNVSRLSIVNGYASSAAYNASGGCIQAYANLRLEEVTVSHCKVSGLSATGGSVYVRGYAALIKSNVSDSSATVSSGDGFSAGGGAYVGGNLYMRGTTIDNNVAFAPSGTGEGGGIFARGFVNIVESTVSANQADYGGGIYLPSSFGNVATITNSTVSGNTATLVGGIISVRTLNLYNCTIAFNRSSSWGAYSAKLAAGVFVEASTANVSSTIISNNVNTGAPYLSDDLSGFGVVFSGESNNVAVCDHVVCPADTTHDDPGLHPLQDNGGPTKTHVPTPGAWDSSHGTNRRGAVWDQRGIGFPRAPLGMPIEIGAYQTNPDILFVNGFN